VDSQTDKDNTTKLNFDDIICQQTSALPYQSIDIEPRFIEMYAPDELKELLSYLQVDYQIFSRFEEQYFRKLKGLLVEHQIVNDSDSVDRSNFKSAVLEFQKKRSISVDGIVGEETLWELQFDKACTDKYPVVKVTADIFPGRDGYDCFWLRKDVADAYIGLYRSVKDAGGFFTSAGSLRELSAPVSTGRSPTSMHYTGLALDLSIVTGMQDLNVDPYLIASEGTRWKVWGRVSSGAARTIDALKYENGKVISQVITVTAVDFTQMAVAAGFRDIGPRACFPGNYICAEWWHLQYENALTPFISQFGIELLKIYGIDTLIKYPEIWKNRMRIFQKPNEGWH